MQITKQRKASTDGGPAAVQTFDRSAGEAQHSPTAERPVLEPGAGDSVERRATQAGLILLIEDDFLLRGALTEWLRDSGYQVECAASGAEALRRLHAPPKPSLMLLDIMLPYMDGIALRSVQLGSPEIADIPVIVISAIGVSAADAQRLELPSVFTKPLDLPRLMETIGTVCKPSLS
jgi:CheY-like chemotaxis protein